MQSLDKGISPKRNVRVPDLLWDLFTAVCEHEGDSRSDVIRSAIIARVADYADMEVSGDTVSFICRVCSWSEVHDDFATAVQVRYEYNGWCTHCASAMDEL
jgi:metal-responsive CopG/Arc/MetJ family transcriptional regulator